MYIAITGSKNNKDVYIYRSFRKENGKASSCIYKKLRKYNALLEQFDGNEYKLMVWAKEQAAKETELYKQHTGKVSVEFSKAATFISYAKGDGDKLIGRSLLECHNSESRDKIQQVVDWFAVDESHNIVYTFHNEKQNKDVYMVALRDDGKLIGYYEKHEYRNAETMK